jgi:Family of unknown function (DUF5681)
MADKDSKEDNEDSDENYVVGPGRPPKHSQFKAHTSGNLKGRPKGSVSIGALLQKESLKKVPASEGGRTKSLSKLQIIVHRIMNGAMKGDHKATVLFLNELAKINAVQSTDPPAQLVPNLDIAATRRIAERVMRDAKEREQEEAEKKEREQKEAEKDPPHEPR